MHYEDVAFKKGETLWGHAEAYGFPGGDWTKIWDDAKNAALRAKRGEPRKIQVGDVIQIPIGWTILKTTMTKHPSRNGIVFVASRTGREGKQLRWAQTVDRHNQPFGGAPYGKPRFVIDPASPPDDNLPFYFTDAELTAKSKRRKEFVDAPFRNAPSVALGKTEWRAMLSIAVYTEKRVTLLDTYVWGFDKGTDDKLTHVPARKANAAERKNHLKLMQNGFGLKDLPGTKADFKDMGWSFRLG
ncbi:hypothetical protein [Tropicimonas sp. IMCC6043]|uniref:hypothetical protein n=1 Tax=Tropicimonas sp. IMCC6043 TaxID=2510645 RepID=UPI00101DA363|nr:hypothetical protein [Tropicimonas sp. IMCC6043]RYH08579.1 hypothetical protein EU800_16195 [Tropicimonas sp. IMCC6043]